MSDNLFDRLFELFQSPGPVNWKLAREVIGSVAGEADVIEPRLSEEYVELGLAAQLHSADTPGITVPAAGALEPVDRATWARDNEQSFRYFFEPLADRIGTMGEGPMGSMLAPLGPALLGMQAGTLVGVMSHDALGQFDAGLPALDRDRRYLIVPNVEALADDHGLDNRQVRLWAATRETIHHALLDTPWLRGRVVHLVGDLFADLEFDPTKLTERLGDLQDPSQLEALLGDNPALPTLLGGDVDPVKQDRIAALFVTIDGFGRWATTRALADLVPQVDAIHEAASREEPTQADAALAQLAGITIDRDAAVRAATFVLEVERRWGIESIETLWSDADHVPTLAELEDPVGWAARVLL